MTKYEVFSRLYAYNGPYGDATKEQIHSIFEDRLDQAIMGFTNDFIKTGNDSASSQITTLGLASRQKRDMAYDAINPQQKLPEDMTSARLIETVPAFGWSPGPLMSRPEDFEAKDQVNLVQMSFLHAAQQERLYTDPNLFGKDEFKDKVENPVKPMNEIQSYSFDGSAAGYETNRLGGESRAESYRENSIEYMTAF